MYFGEAVERYLIEVILPRRPKHRTLLKTKGELRLLVRHFGPETPVEAISTRNVTALPPIADE